MVGMILRILNSELVFYNSTKSVSVIIPILQRQRVKALVQGLRPSSDGAWIQGPTGDLGAQCQGELCEGPSPAGGVGCRDTLTGETSFHSASPLLPQADRKV